MLKQTVNLKTTTQTDQKTCKQTIAYDPCDLIRSKKTIDLV